MASQDTDAVFRNYGNCSFPLCRHNVRRQQRQYTMRCPKAALTFSKKSKSCASLKKPTTAVDLVRFRGNLYAVPNSGHVAPFTIKIADHIDLAPSASTVHSHLDPVGLQFTLHEPDLTPGIFPRPSMRSSSSHSESGLGLVEDGSIGTASLFFEHFG